MVRKGPLHRRLWDAFVINLATIPTPVMCHMREAKKSPTGRECTHPANEDHATWFLGVMFMADRWKQLWQHFQKWRTFLTLVTIPFWLATSRSCLRHMPRHQCSELHQNLASAVDPRIDQWCCERLQLSPNVAIQYKSMVQPSQGMTRCTSDSPRATRPGGQESWYNG